jgi:hypothetical protein
MIIKSSYLCVCVHVFLVACLRIKVILNWRLELMVSNFATACLTIFKLRSERLLSVMVRRTMLTLIPNATDSIFETYMLV